MASRHAPQQKALRRSTFRIFGVHWISTALCAIPRVNCDWSFDTALLLLSLLYYSEVQRWVVQTSTWGSEPLHVSVKELLSRSTAADWKGNNFNGFHLKMAKARSEFRTWLAYSFRLRSAADLERKALRRSDLREIISGFNSCQPKWVVTQNDWLPLVWLWLAFITQLFYYY